MTYQIGFQAVFITPAFDLHLFCQSLHGSGAGQLIMTIMVHEARSCVMQVRKFATIIAQPFKVCQQLSTVSAALAASSYPAHSFCASADM